MLSRSARRTAGRPACWSSVRTTISDNPNPGTVASPPTPRTRPYYFPVEYGSLDGLAIDTATSTLYFASGTILFDHDSDGGTAPIVQPGGIFSYALTGNPAGGYASVPATVGSGPQGLLGDLEIDPVTGRWYAVDYTGGTTRCRRRGIWTGNLDGTGTRNAVPDDQQRRRPVPQRIRDQSRPDDRPHRRQRCRGRDPPEPVRAPALPVQPLAGIDVSDFQTADDADQLAGATSAHFGRVRIGTGACRGTDDRRDDGGILGSGSPTALTA